MRAGHTSVSHLIGMSSDGAAAMKRLVKLLEDESVSRLKVFSCIASHIAMS